MNITIYSRQGCAPCNSLKQFLNKKNVPFITRDVDEPDAAAEAYAYTGLSTVPVTVIEREGERKVISGLNLSQLLPAIS